MKSHVWSSSSGNNCHAVHRSLSSGASVYECTMGIFFTSSHFICQYLPTQFPLITAIRMCHFLPVHHSEWHFRRVEGQNAHILSSTDRSVSFYQNSSVWLDILDSRSWVRNPVDSNAKPKLYPSQPHIYIYIYIYIYLEENNVIFYVYYFLEIIYNSLNGDQLITYSYTDKLLSTHKTPVILFCIVVRILPLYIYMCVCVCVCVCVFIYVIFVLFELFFKLNN